MDEQQAILRLKQGDIGGLEVLVNRYQTRAVRTAYLITGDAALAEDIVQEAFVRAFHAVRGFQAGRPFEPWFLRSVANASIKAMKKARRQVHLGDEIDQQTFAEILTRVRSPEAQVESDQLQSQVWEALNRLSARQRAVVVQRYFLEMSEKDMAASSNTASGTIKWLLHAARDRLRTMLAERSDE